MTPVYPNDTSPKPMGFFQDHQIGEEVASFLPKLLLISFLLIAFLTKITCLKCTLRVIRHAAK